MFLRVDFLLSISLSSEHVSRQRPLTSTDPSPDVDSQVSFDSFTLVLDPDETEEEESEGDSGDVEMADHYRLCPERSLLKMKRNSNRSRENQNLSIN